MKTFLIDNPILFLFLATIVLLVIWNIFLNYHLWQVKRKLKTFFNGKKATDLEGVLFEEIKRLKKAEKDIEQLFNSSKILKKMASQSIQKIGIVRFNPFKETGGNQSFAIALLDSKDNGLVISSLFTRQGTRIYSKPIEAGQSKYSLSKEEIEALGKAGAKIKK
jgi:cell division protein FtsL